MVTDRARLSVRVALPAVALSVTCADPIVAVEVAENFTAALPFPGAARLAGAKVADTPAGKPWTAKVTDELNPPCIATVTFVIAVLPRLSVNVLLLELSATPGTSNVKVDVLVTPPPVAVTASV